MDRKMRHYDKPGHQRWLYRLADLGLVKAIILIWAICWAIIVMSLLLAKAVISYFK